MANALPLMLIASVLLVSSVGPMVHAAEEDAKEKPSAEALAQEAFTAWNIKRQDKALRLMGEAIAAAPKNAKLWDTRAWMHTQLGNHSAAVKDYDAIFELPEKTWGLRRGRTKVDAATLHQVRGVANFKAGHIEASIADFDAYLKANPAEEPHHWQRGISYYYAKRFKDGVRQFEIHRKVNPNDVENAAWHFLCKARASSVEDARKQFIPIERDGRVPMMKVHAMFAEKATPADVLAACKVGDPNEGEMQNRLFYAHLYIGLYYEALGKNDLAAKHITLAATKHYVPHYMGDVAKVHHMLMKKAAKKNDKPDATKNSD